METTKAPIPRTHPATGPWWPSEWGPDDERGALNRLGSEQVAAAARMVRSGDIVDMGFAFQPGLPDFHGRDFTLAIAGGPSGGPVGAGRFMYNDELISGRFTGMSTHFNALVHVGQQLGEDGDNRSIHYYNGFSHADIGGAWGFRRLGVEGVTPIFTTAIMADILAYRGEPMAHGDLITIDDIRGALARQGMGEDDILPGSAFFWRTGNDQFWYSDPQRYISGSAGVLAETAEWIADKGVVVVGSDAVSLEPIPSIDNRMAEVHATFLCRRGVHIIVNIDLSGVAARQAWRFAFTCTPIPFVGAQGSPVRPYAIL